MDGDEEGVRAAGQDAQGLVADVQVGGPGRVGAVYYDGGS